MGGGGRLDAEPSGEVYTWRPQDVVGLEFITTRYEPLTFEPHLHDAWEFVWCQKGGGVAHYGNADRDVSPGTLLLFAPGEVHGGSSEKGWQTRSLTVAPDIFEEVVVGLTGQVQPFRCLEPLLPTTFAAKFAELCAVFDGPGSSLEREEKLLFLVGDVVETFWDDTKPVGKEARMVEAMKTYLNFHYARDILTKDLATLAEMPEAYMVSVFKQATGVTPSAYQTLMRLAKARALLAWGETQEHTAVRTGFAEVGVLDAAFRRVYKLSLAAYVRGLT